MVYLKILKWFFISSIILAIAIIIYFPNYAKFKKIREEKVKLRSEIKKLSEEIKDLREKNKEVTKDTYIKEKIAREDLGVAKEGEIVVDIKE
jgi:cell division protein FtsB